MDRKGAGKFPFPEGWSSGEIPVKGNKENLTKEITHKPSSAAAAKQRKVVYLEIHIGVKNDSTSPHQRENC
jgi:hypothetical protein